MRLAPALVLAATPGLAECPTGDDLAGKGLRFTGAGMVQTYRAEPDGVVQMQAEYADSADWETRDIYGVYPVSEADPYPVGDTGAFGSVSQYALSVARAALPVPEPGVTVEMMMAHRLVYEGAPEGGVPQPDQHLRFRFGARTTITIAGCRYDAVPVTLERDNDAWNALGSYYLPGFGFALSSDSIDENDMPTFDWVETIEVLP